MNSLAHFVFFHLSSYLNLIFFKKEKLRFCARLVPTFFHRLKNSVYLFKTLHNIYIYKVFLMCMLIEPFCFQKHCL